MRFRVTYWPGTAQFEGNYVAFLIQSGRIKDYEKVKFFDFNTHRDAVLYTAGAYIDTSDGCLIEYVRTCNTCKREFYTLAESRVMCPECEHDLTLA